MRLSLPYLHRRDVSPPLVLHIDTEDGRDTHVFDLGALMEGQARRAMDWALTEAMANELRALANNLDAMASKWRQGEMEHGP